MRLNRRKTLVLAGSTVAATTLAMPAVISPSRAASKLNVGALRFTSHAGSFVALQRGYFKDAGLDVELKFFQAAQPMAVAIASGDADFAVTAITGGLVSLAQKGAVKVIGGALQEEKGIDGQKILVSDAAMKAGVDSPKKLDGKSFAVTQAGSSFHYMGSKIAATEGITLNFKPLQKVGAIIGAMKSGQVDGWAIVPHIAKGLAKSGAVHVVGDVATYLPDYQVTTVFTSEKNASGDAEKVKAFLAAYSKGVADYNAAMVDKTAGDDARDEMVRLLHTYVYADRPLEKAAPGIINGSMRLNESAKLNVASVQDQLDWYKQEKLIDQNVTLETVVNTSYAETF